jgi:hypothetical protein
VSKIVSPLLGLFGAIASFAGQPWLPLALFGAKAGVGYLTGDKKQRGGDQPIAHQAPPPDYKVTVEHPLAPRVISYGRVQNPGAFIFKEAGPAKNVLLYGFYMCDGPIDGIESITCDDEYVAWIPGSPYLSPVPSQAGTIWAPGPGAKWVQYSAGVFGPLIFIETISATEDGFQSYLLSQLGPNGAVNGVVTADTGLVNFWDGSHLGKGVTMFYAWGYLPTTYNGANRQTYWPNNWPLYQFVYRGAPVYDPRDPGQAQNDPTSGAFTIYNPTWKWSENPALIAANYVSRLIANGQTAIKGVNWASIAEAADDCDRLCPCFIRNFGDGGLCYEPFARMTGNVSLDLEPRDVLAKIMAICDGAYGLDQNGFFSMWIGKWEAPNVVFTDSDVIGLTQEFQPPLAEQYNYFNITYTEPRQRYSPMQAPLYQDKESQARIGRRQQTVGLDYCPSPSQAWRMVRRHAMRENRRRVTVRLAARGLLAFAQRIVGLNCEKFGIIGTFRLLQISPGKNIGEWTAQLAELTEDIFTDPAAPPDPLKNFEVVKAPTLPTPVPYLSVAPDATTGGGAVRIDYAQKVSVGTFLPLPTVNLVVDPNLIWDARYSTDGGTTWRQVNVLISQFSVQTPVLPKGTAVTVQARYIPNNGAPGGWGSSVSITI